MPVSYRYVRWKAVLFGGIATAIAMATLWVGIEAADPSWTATVTKGQWLVDAPAAVRAPALIAFAGFLLVPSLWLIAAGLAGAIVVTITDTGISARTTFGRPRRLGWPDVVAIRRSRNRITLSPAEVDTLGQQIWDRRSVLIDTGMLDVAPCELESVIRRLRPDLALVDE